LTCSLKGRGLGEKGHHTLIKALENLAGIKVGSLEKMRNNLEETTTLLGIIVLGQTPRPDLEAIYNTYLPGVELSIVGALDGMETPNINRMANEGDEYPLLIILADGTTREISLYRLFPLLEKKAEALSKAGAEAAVLMCAGDFPDLKCSIPIIYPGRVVPAVVSAISGTKRIGIITPNPGQMEPAQEHWRKKGFIVKAAVASPRDPSALEAVAAEMRDSTLELVVLDCMGFGPDVGRRMRRLCGRPVICPQTLVARVTAEMMGN
jgi:protein AroM